MCDAYENDCIFDRFDICSSPCSNFMITGMFDKSFHVVDKQGEKNV